VAKALGIDRKTVARYRTWAQEQGLLEGSLPSLGELQRLAEETLDSSPPPQNTSSVEHYRQVVAKLRREGVEIAAIHQRLKERGYTGSYSSVYRFVRNLEPRMPDVTVRVETPPGEEAQVDFGYAGQMVDPDTGELRKTWMFVMTLSWSRHQYVEFVFDQKVGTWLRLHRNAFAFFRGYMRNRQVLEMRRSCFDRDCYLGYTSAAQRKRGKSVASAMAFPRFSLLGLHGAQAGSGHHCLTSPSAPGGCSDPIPRAAVA
jgi:hypothetical protein